MKKLALSFYIFAGAGLYAQNQIPTTQVNGSMRIDSVATIHGETTMKDTVHAEKDVKVAGDAYVEGDITVKGDFKLGQNFAMSETTNTNGQPYLYLGNPLGKTASTNSFGFTCLNNFSSPNNLIKTGSNISIFGVNPNVSNLYSSLELGYDGSNAYIDVTGGANISQPGQTNAPYNPKLLINSYCGKDIEMNNGQTKGYVKIGKYLELGNVVRSPSIVFNMQTANSFSKALSIFNTDINKEIFSILSSGTTNINTVGSTSKAITINNTTTGKEVFSVKPDGTTYIGSERVISGPHTDALLTVSGKVACKEVRVFNVTNYWADFVFDNGYKLTPLNEIERFYKEHKHLPNIPTADEIKQNGNDLAVTDALLLQKIEELTMHIVELNKRIEILEQSKKQK